MALTIRQTEEDNQKIEEIKNTLGMKSTSKMMLHLVHEYENMVKKIERLEIENDELNNQIEKTKSIVKDYLSAKKEIKNLEENFKKTPDCCLNCFNFMNTPAKAICEWGIRIPYKKQSCKKQDPIE